MVEFLVAFVVAQSIIVIALAALLVWRGSRSPVVWAAATIIGGFGLVALSQLIRGNLGEYSFGPFTGRHVTRLGFAVINAAEVAFACLYPSFRAVGWRGKLLGLAAFPILVATLFVAADVAGVESLAVFLLHVMDFVQLYFIAISLLILGLAYLRAEPSFLRTQFLYALLPFLVWAVNHIVPELFGPAFGRPRPDQGSFSPEVLGSGILKAAIVLFIAAAAAVDAVRRPDRRRQDLVLPGWTLLLVPLAFLQFLDPNLHLLVDGLSVVLLFYGIARYQILEVDLRIPSRVRQAVRGAFALPVFFITQQAIETVAGQLLGVVAAVVAAGLGLFLIQFLQTRLAATPSKASPPDLAAYEAYRRMEIYRTALEGVYADGTIDPAESRTLAGLRDKLGVTTAEHRALQRDVAAARARPTA